MLTPSDFSLFTFTFFFQMPFLKKLSLVVFVFSFLFQPSLAQKNVKKDIAQAQAFIKSRKNLDKAEQLMRKLLTDSANQHNIKIYVVLTEALRAQYEQGNEKMYLRQKVDTAAIFNLAKRMFDACEQLDSLDMLPDEKGRVKMKYRERNANYLHRYRRNLFNGGLWFIGKQKYPDALTFLGKYYDCHRKPLYTSLHYTPDSVAAYWALFSAYKLGDAHKSLCYGEVARKDSAHLEYTLQYLAEAYFQLKDTAKYVATLHEGFYSYRKSDYFFTHLVDYYNQRGLYHSSLDIVNTALQCQSDNAIMLYAKSNILLNMGQYDECIAVCEGLIAIDSLLSEAYYNAGAAWLNKAFEAEHADMKTAARRKYQEDCHRHALPYMERYRALRPDDKDKWAAALYNIYLNLNMGKQFEEIVSIIRN